MGGTESGEIPLRHLGALLSKGIAVRIHDPFVREWEFGPQVILSDFDEAIRGSDCLALVTKHDQYLSLDLTKVKSLMQTPAIVDGRNVLNQKKIEASGFEYRGVGKAGTKKQGRS